MMVIWEDPRGGVRGVIPKNRYLRTFDLLLEFIKTQGN